MHAVKLTLTYSFIAVTGEQDPLDEDESFTAITGEQDLLDEDENFIAITGEQDLLDEDVMLNILRALAAKAAAIHKMKLAIQKRKEAQSLAEKADLAIYKATMSVRISETTEAGGSTEVSIQHFLD
jgi:hypothetical protein